MSNDQKIKEKEKTKINTGSKTKASSKAKKQYQFSTLCATVESPDDAHKDQYGASSVPIYQTATFKGMGGEYDYTRSGNPTRSHLEHHLAKISGAKHAFAVSSGMAALDVITRMLKPGEEVITGDDLYGGTNRLLSYLKVHGGVTVHHVDTTKPDTIVPLLNEKTAMVLLENPTNPLLKIADVARICSDVKQRAPKAVIVVDNTMMSPYLQRPLEHGADLIYDSGTKYLSGHHDLMAGVIVCDREDLAKQIAFVINASGNALAPFDAFLLLRGTKTLAIRMDRQQSTAMSVASYLHQLGFTVHYPGLASHPGRDIHYKLAKGPGAVLSFTTGSRDLSERIVAGTRLWGISVSFGAVNSLISMPCAMSHASIPQQQRAERGLPEDLIRLCVGIEDPGDLLDDLESALINAGAIKESDVRGENSWVRILPGGVGTEGTSRALMRLESEIQAQDAVAHTLDKGWLVSSPGKVILFGEHAVVHGVTAIAAAVDLRCYALSTPLPSGVLTLTFPEIGSFKHTWSIDDDLPWSSMAADTPNNPDVLDQGLVDAILESDSAIPPSLRGDDEEVVRKRSAALCFLYLYMVLAKEGKRPSLEFTTRSTLPLGAGMGSSACYSTCLAATFLLHNGYVVPPINLAVSEKVNQWAYTGERILHGNPSGVDNAVAVHGGGMAFTRPGFGYSTAVGMDGIKGFKEIALLLTDTRVPRSTKKLVAGVAKMKEEQPERVHQLLSSIQNISERASTALTDPSRSRESLFEELERCVSENHQHLVELGVSHPALEQIRQITAAEPFSLRTKLTGAGGGGCAVTLLPDDFDPKKLSALQSQLLSAGFQPYVTSVGGPGFGIFDIRKQAREDNTPPQTPDGYVPDIEKEIAALVNVFEYQSQQNIPSFGTHEGLWHYA